MVLGELGRFPIKFYISQRMLNYWGKIVTSKESKINVILYHLITKLEKNGCMKKSPWITNIKKLLNDCNM